MLFRGAQGAQAFEAGGSVEYAVRSYGQELFKSIHAAVTAS